MSVGSPEHSGRSDNWKTEEWAVTKAHTSDLAQRVNIGDFTIELRGGDFWIVHKSGEGATFPVEQFEQAVREFYDEHF